MSPGSMPYDALVLHTVRLRYSLFFKPWDNMHNCICPPLNRLHGHTTVCWIIVQQKSFLLIF